MRPSLIVQDGVIRAPNRIQARTLETIERFFDPLRVGAAGDSYEPKTALRNEERARSTVEVAYQGTHHAIQPLGAVV